MLMTIASISRTPKTYGTCRLPSLLASVFHSIDVQENLWVHYQSPGKLFEIYHSKIYGRRIGKQ